MAIDADRLARESTPGLTADGLTGFILLMSVMFGLTSTNLSLTKLLLPLLVFMLLAIKVLIMPDLCCCKELVTSCARSGFTSGVPANIKGGGMEAAADDTAAIRAAGITGGLTSVKDGDEDEVLVMILEMTGAG